MRRRNAAPGRLQFRQGRLCARGLGGAAWAGLLGRVASGLRLPRGSVAAFYVRPRLLFAAERQTGRLAVSCVSIPPWVGIAISTFSNVVRLSDFVGSLWACAFLWAISTEYEVTESAARQSTLLREHISF